MVRVPLLKVWMWKKLLRRRMMEVTNEYNNCKERRERTVRGGRGEEKMDMKIFLPPWMPALRARGQKIHHAEAQSQ